MFISNYHTHTKRCGHATGEDEDYVLEAIGYGYRNLGFSDHAMLPDFSEPYTRGDFSLFHEYCDSIRSLAKKYEEQKLSQAIFLFSKNWSRMVFSTT